VDERGRAQINCQLTNLFPDVPRWAEIPERIQTLYPRSMKTTGTEYKICVYLSTLFHRVDFSPFRGRSRMGSLILERASVTYEVEFCRFALDLFTRAGIPATDWSKAFFRNGRSTRFRDRGADRWGGNVRPLSMLSSRPNELWFSMTG